LGRSEADCLAGPVPEFQPEIAGRKLHPRATSAPAGGSGTSPDRKTERQEFEDALCARTIRHLRDDLKGSVVGTEIAEEIIRRREGEPDTSLFSLIHKQLEELIENPRNLPQPEVKAIRAGLGSARSVLQTTMLIYGEMTGPVWRSD
jgi:hypothetical protein